MCKRCVGAPVLIPADLVSCETVNPTCLPMRAGVALGAGFAFAVVLFSELCFVLSNLLQNLQPSVCKAREKPI